MSLEHDYQFVIKDQDQSASNGPQNVGEIAFEKCLWSFVFGNFPPTIHGTFVHFFALTRHHHQPASHCVKGICNRDRASRHSLSNCKFGGKTGKKTVKKPLKTVTEANVWIPKITSVCQTFLWRCHRPQNRWLGTQWCPEPSLRSPDKGPGLGRRLCNICQCSQRGL